MTHYLIEFRFFGSAKKEIKKLVWEIDKKFRLGHAKRHRPIPHISLVGPFSTKDEKRLVSNFRRTCEKESIIPFNVEGYETFEDTKVVFINVKPSPELNEFRWKLSKTIQPYCRLKKWDLERKFEYHATIAMKLGKEKFKKIKNYVNSKPKLNLKHVLLRATLIRNQRILYEYDFLLKRMLNRRQAKSSLVLSETFSKLKEHIKNKDSEKLGACVYHLCKKRTNVYKCRHCGEYFCKEHLRAKPPGTPDFKASSPKSLALMENWRKEGSHPCIPYYDYAEKEIERKEEEYKQSLDRVIGSKPLHVRRHRPPIWEPRHDKSPYYDRRKEQAKKAIIIILIIAIVGYFLYIGVESGQIQSFLANATNNISGFLSKTTNIHVPEFERQINEIQETISVSPERKTQCEEAFAYLNQLRENYDRSELLWDDRIYELAVFRSKDMYQRDYFDHITPEGKCAEDFKKDFNITEYGNFAENLGGLTHYVGGDPVPETNVNEAVDGWMESRGHRYALLYPYTGADIRKSAIGCYKHICTFLVLTRELFECVHGDEGLEYWETVPKQPGEV